VQKAQIVYWLLTASTLRAQIHAVAKNIFNFVVVADLASAEGLAAATALTDMIEDEYSVRIGILPSLPADEPGMVSRKVF